MTDPPPQPSYEDDPPGPGWRSLRLVLRLAGLAAVIALSALLFYGLTTRAADTTIDDSLARNQPIQAPSYRLKVLRAGDLGPVLERKVGPALADGWVSPAELRGTPYVLNFWASWCIPCREEAPDLVAVWRRSRPDGVLFLGLNMQDAREDAGKFLDRFDIDYPNIRDPTNETSRRYGATGLPETYFVNARGEIVNHVIGVASAQQLRRGVAAAVTGRPSAARRGGDRRPTR